MKYLLISASVLLGSFSLGSSSLAADRVIGPVQAIERDMDNVFQSCVDQVKDPNQQQSIFFCSFPLAKTKTEFTTGRQFMLQYGKDGCSVEAVVENTFLTIMFGLSQGSSSFATAKNCFSKALDASANKDHFKFIIYSAQ
jgi:hypothetical protein